MAVAMNQKRHTKESRTRFLLKLFKVLGILSYIASGVFLVLSVVLQIDSVRARYDQYLVALATFENHVAGLKNQWLTVIVIALLYILRSLSPVYPFPALYIMTAMVFSPVHSFIINMAGMAFNIAFRYYTGVQMGEGFWNKVLHRYPDIDAVFQVDARGNPLVLFALRFVPVLPFSTISHLYGTFEYPFVKYMIISMAALVPRLVSYSFIGNNVYDPLSTRFFIPLIVLFFITGTSFFVMRSVYKLVLKLSGKTTKAVPAAEAEPEERTEQNHEEPD